MRRRAFVGAAVTAALAGCVGYQIEETADVEAREARIEELRSEVESLETDIEGLDAEVESLEGDIEERDEKIAEQARSIDSLQRGHVVRLYELATSARGYAAGDWNMGVDELDAEHYRSAAVYFRGAYSDYGQSETLFGETRTVSSDYELGVRDVITDSLSYVRLLKEAAFDLSNAASYYAEGDVDAAEAFFSKAEDHLDAAEGYEVKPADEFRSHLYRDVEGKPL